MGRFNHQGSEMRSPLFGLTIVVILCTSSVASLAENFHDLKFFLHPDLVGPMGLDQLKSNLAQYADDINFIFSKQTNRRFLFDPDSGITITDTKPQTDSAGILPEEGYELWVHAVLTDLPSYGTYGGYMGFDISGAGVAAGLKWDAVHDPAALVAGSGAVEQYWRQIDHIVHEFEHVYGAGHGEYYNLAFVDDTTGVDPLLNIRKQATDAFWSQRQDYFPDPLLNNVYNLGLVGSPTTLADLRDAVQFADVTVAVVDLGPRFGPGLVATLPDLFEVEVAVLDSETGLPIPDVTVRVWNVRSGPPYLNEELPVTSTMSPGVHAFWWDPYPHISVFGNFDHLKLIKAYANGYEAIANWVSSFDAQQEKLIHGNDNMVITLSLGPLLGDINRDGLVNAADYTLWANTFDQIGENLPADLNGNGVVDAADYTIWADHFGATSFPPSQQAFGPAAVPEPSTLVLACCGLLGLTVRCWRRRTRA